MRKSVCVCKYDATMLPPAAPPAAPPVPPASPPLPPPPLPPLPVCDDPVHLLFLLDESVSMKWNDEADIEKKVEHFALDTAHKLSLDPNIVVSGSTKYNIPHWVSTVSAITFRSRSGSDPGYTVVQHPTTSMQNFTQSLQGAAGYHPGGCYGVPGQSQSLMVTETEYCRRSSWLPRCACGTKSRCRVQKSHGTNIQLGLTKAHEMFKREPFERRGEVTRVIVLLADGRGTPSTAKFKKIVDDIHEDALFGTTTTGGWVDTSVAREMDQDLAKACFCAGPSLRQQE